MYTLCVSGMSFRIFDVVLMLMVVGIYGVARWDIPRFAFPLLVQVSHTKSETLHP